MEECFDRIGNYFALDKDTGKIRHVNDVDRGLKCNCICPECKNRMIARKGEKRKYYFAHESSADVNARCGSGETIIHILGKEIMKETSVFFLPEQSYSDCNIRDDIKGIDRTFKKVTEISIGDGNWQVRVEEMDDNSNFVPDIILYNDKYNNDNNKIWVEIKRTHGIDQKKADYIIKKAIPTIELDLTNDSIFEGTENEQELKERIKEILITKEKNTYLRWFYLPVAHRKILEANTNDGSNCLYVNSKCGIHCQCCIARDAKRIRQFCLYDPETVERDKEKITDLMQYMADETINDFDCLYVSDIKEKEYNTLSIMGLLDALEIKPKAHSSLKKFLIERGQNACVILQDNKYHNFGVACFGELKMILHIKNRNSLVNATIDPFRNKNEMNILNKLANKHESYLCMQLIIDMQKPDGEYYSNKEIVSKLKGKNRLKIQYYAIGDRDIKTVMEYIKPVISLNYMGIYGYEWNYHFCPLMKNVKIYISDKYPYIGEVDDKGCLNTNNQCLDCDKFAGFDRQYNYCISSINW